MSETAFLPQGPSGPPLTTYHEPSTYCTKAHPSAHHNRDHSHGPGCLPHCLKHGENYVPWSLCCSLHSPFISVLPCGHAFMRSYPHLSIYQLLKCCFLFFYVLQVPLLYGSAVWRINVEQTLNINLLIKWCYLRTDRWFSLHALFHDLPLPCSFVASIPFSCYLSCHLTHYSRIYS